MAEMYVGQIFMIGFTFAPSGSLMCNGLAVPLTQYQALYSLIGTAFGGNGTSNFALPDLRVTFPIGANAAAAVPLGHRGGATQSTVAGLSAAGTFSLAVANLPSHNHPLTGGVTVSTSVATNGSLANQPKPGSGLLAKATDASTGTIVNTYTSAASDGTTLGGVSSTVTSTLGVGNTGTGTPVGVSLPVPAFAVPTVPPYLAINYAICTNGIYPPRPS
jgi:microcystin-dependent protein